MYRPNSLKARLEAGDNIYGAWIGSGSPANAEILGHVGFDFVVVDQEHGAGELADAVAALRAVEVLGHALHRARTLERPDLDQAHLGCWCRVR